MECRAHGSREDAETVRLTAGTAAIEVLAETAEIDMGSVRLQPDD
jgi:hypothetical protein